MDQLFGVAWPQEPMTLNGKNRCWKHPNQQDDKMEQWETTMASILGTKQPDLVYNKFLHHIKPSV